MRLRTVGAVVLAALIGAGCGSGASPDTAGDAKGAARDKAVRFSACMREHGVPHFPDPDPSGDFDFGIDVSPAVWQRALDACKALRPPGSFSAQRSPEQQSGALAFARCIREHGVHDFPDPVNGEPLVDTTKIPSTDRPGGMTILNAAMRTCGDLAEAVLRKRP